MFYLDLMQMIDEGDEVELIIRRFIIDLAFQNPFRLLYSKNMHKLLVL